MKCSTAKSKSFNSESHNNDVGNNAGSAADPNWCLVNKNGKKSRNSNMEAADPLEPLLRDFSHKSDVSNFRSSPAFAHSSTFI